MTIETSNVVSGPFVGNGVTTIFPRTFSIGAEEHLIVISEVAGIQTELSTGFTVSTPDLPQGDVVFDVAPDATTQILFTRRTPDRQDTDYSSQGSVSPEQIEDDLDYRTRRSQENARDVARAFKSPIGETGKSVASIDEGHFYITDADGNLVDGGSADEVTNAQQYALDADNSASEAATFAQQAQDAANSVAAGNFEIIENDFSLLLAIDTTEKTYAIIKDGKRRGSYTWLEGVDATALHAADVYQILYMKADARPSTEGTWRLNREDIFKISGEHLGLVQDDFTPAVVAENTLRLNSALSLSFIGRIVMPWGDTGVDNTLYMWRHGSGLIGFSGIPSFGLADTTRSAIISYHGASNGWLMDVSPTAAAPDDVHGILLDGIQFDGRNIAGRVLHMGGLQNPTIGSIGVLNPIPTSLGVAMYIGSDQHGTGVNTLYLGNFRQLSIQCLGSAIGLLIDGSDNAGEAATFTTIQNLIIVYDDGPALFARKGDDIKVSVYGCARIAGGLGAGLQFDGNTPGRFFAANMFDSVNIGTTDGTGLIYADGPNIISLEITLNGVDDEPVIQRLNGADVKINFTGAPNYGSPGVATSRAVREVAPFRIMGYDNADPTVVDRYLEFTANPTLVFSGQTVAPTYVTNELDVVVFGGSVFVNGTINISSKGAAPAGSAALIVMGTGYSALKGSAISVGFYSGFNASFPNTPVGSLAGDTITLYKPSTGFATPLLFSDVTDAMWLNFSVQFNL